MSVCGDDVSMRSVFLLHLEPVLAITSLRLGVMALLCLLLLLAVLIVFEWWQLRR
jgi:hypothetical protein